MALWFERHPEFGEAFFWSEPVDASAPSLQTGTVERFLNRGVVVFLLVGSTLTVAGLAISRSFWVDASRVNELVCSVRLGGEHYRLTLIPRESRVSASLFGPSGLDWSTNPAAEFESRPTSSRGC